MGSRRWRWRWIWIWTAGAAVLLMVYSSKGGVVSQTNQKAEAEQTAPTGYPSGEIQRASVCYNGTLYLYTADGFDLPLGDGFEKAGTIAAVDNTEYPSEDFHASRLDPGQEVYGNRDEPDRIYVKYNSGFGLFEKAEDGLNTLDGVTMKAVEGSADSGSVKLCILNETDLDIMFGENYELQHFVNGQWQSVPYIIDNWTFNAVGYEARKGSPAEITVNWEIFHGSMEPGNCRIIKTVNDFRGTGDYTTYYLAAEFEIRQR